MLPIIGVTPSLDHESQRYMLSPEYTAGVRAAGGVPVMLPYADDAAIERLLGVLNGILLSGGVDVDPVHFQEEPLPQLGRVCPDRDRAELRLTRKVLEAGLPILGICRGAQLLNVAAGGSLCQDIPTQVRSSLKHSQTAPRWHPTHAVNLEAGGITRRLLGVPSIRVNSFHHQAVGRPAPGFAVTARAGDGVIEAIEGPGFTVGIQWHPECMWEKDPIFLGLFRGLVEAASP
ncbi:MAG TPA: peptidase C26 [Clostridiales bacterium UBA8153]|nr:peptidase C26 [Clostridiales bacterium UBA8153]